MLIIVSLLAVTAFHIFLIRTRISELHIREPENISSFIL